MIALLLFLTTSAAWADLPTWATQETLQRHGQELLIVCTGEDRDLARARALAVSSCAESAAAQLPTTWLVSAASKETDRDVTLKREVVADQRVEGLDCEVKHEYLQNSDDGWVKVFDQCRFDLSKAHSVARNIEDATRGRAMRLHTAPECDEVWVYGGPYARTVKCENGVAEVKLMPEEHRLTVKSKRGNLFRDYEVPDGVSFQEINLRLDKRGN